MVLVYLLEVAPGSLCGLKVLVGLGGEGGGRENGKEKGIAGALHLGRL